MTESLNDRLDRMESEIKSLSDKIKPKQIDIVKEINDAIERNITKEFITELYRGK